MKKSLFFAIVFAIFTAFAAPLAFAETAEQYLLRFSGGDWVVDYSASTDESTKSVEHEKIARLAKELGWFEFEPVLDVQNVKK